MTTLPTTTPMRLPRPVAQAPLALPGPAHVQPGSGFQMTGADVWRVIRSNIWLILGMFILSGVVGFGLFKYLDRYYASYTASGYCQVNNPQFIDLLKAAQMPNTDVSA